jgi:hypothetical protein
VACTTLAGSSLTVGSAAIARQGKAVHRKTDALVRLNSMTTSGTPGWMTCENDSCLNYTYRAATYLISNLFLFSFPEAPAISTAELR